MSDLTICEAIPNVIFSPVLADGRVRFESPDGPMSDLFGPVPVLANLSPSQAKDLGLLTPDTSGLHGIGSLKSDALQSSLESRLRQRLTGSISCDVIWKPWNTPWGQCLSKPRARVRNTCGIVVGLWPTVTTPSGGQTIPPGTTMSGRQPDGSKAQVTLQNAVLAVWSTIRASDGEKGGPNMSFGAGGSPLPSQVSTAANTSNAPMENGGGSLHPEFAGWEMGYPPEWLSCAPSETPSTRGQQRNSSALRAKR